MPTTELGRRRQLIPEEQEAALLELAICGGNSHEAQRRLKQQGIQIDSSRLRRMRLTEQRDRYIELCNTHAKRIEEVITAKARENAHMAAEAISEAIAKAREQIKTGDLDASKAAVQLATAQGIQIDKALILEGRPVVITAQRDFDEILHSLSALAPGLVIDGTAVEIPGESAGELGESGESALITGTHEPNARETVQTDGEAPTP